MLKYLCSHSHKHHIWCVYSYIPHVASSISIHSSLGNSCLNIHNERNTGITPTIPFTEFSKTTVSFSVANRLNSFLNIYIIFTQILVKYPSMKYTTSNASISQMQIAHRQLPTWQTRFGSYLPCVLSRILSWYTHKRTVRIYLSGKQCSRVA